MIPLGLLLLLASMAAPPVPAPAPPALPAVEVGFLIAVVHDEALGELGLTEVGVPGLAVAQEHLGPVILAFRLVTLEEQGLARLLGHPALVLGEAAARVHVQAGRDGILSIDASRRDVAGETLLDLRVTGGELAKGVVLRGSGPLGSWAMLGKGRLRDQSVVVIVTAEEETQPDSGTPPAGRAVPAGGTAPGGRAVPATP